MNARIESPATVVWMHWDRDERIPITVTQEREDTVLGNLTIHVDGKRLLRFCGSTAQVAHVRESLLSALAALPPLFSLPDDADRTTSAR